MIVILDNINEYLKNSCKCYIFTKASYCVIGTSVVVTIGQL